MTSPAAAPAESRGAAVANVLLAGVVGSTAYGLAGPDSDVDRLGVFAAPTVAFHGLHPPWGRDATIMGHDPDVTVHEAGKLAALCLGGNPTVTELLWLDTYETATPLGLELVGIRDAFLSAQRVREAYFGYATAQFKRLLNTGLFQSKMRKRVSKHGRHLLRLLDQGFELYSTGHLTIRVADPLRYIDFGERVAKDPEAARPALVEAEERFDQASSPLPDRPDESTVERWLNHVREVHFSALADARRNARLAQACLGRDWRIADLNAVIAAGEALAAIQEGRSVGFDGATTETLRAVRRNLLAGLDRVAASLADGTFDTVRDNGAVPPSESGQLTLALLRGVEAELATRTEEA